MSLLFTKAELRALTLTQLFTLEAQFTAELSATAPGSASRSTLAGALEEVRREIALRHLPKPGF